MSDMKDLATGEAPEPEMPTRPDSPAGNRHRSPARSSPGKRSPSNASPTGAKKPMSPPSNTVTARTESWTTRSSSLSAGSPGSALSKRERARVIGSAPSSLAVSTARRLKPSERQREDKKRLKKKLSKKHFVPGPGTYDPKHKREVGSTSRDLTGSTVFRSRTQRRFDPVKLYGHDGDPGAYEPTVYLSLVMTAKKTFSQAIQDGKVGFNATAERILSFRRGNWNEGEKTPGPAAYKPQVTETGREQDMTTLNGCEAMKSAAFASKVARVPAPHNEKVPGPGQYDPNFESIEPSAHNAMSHVGRDAAVPGGLSTDGPRYASTGAGVGPGSYDAERWETIAYNGEQQLARTSVAQREGRANAAHGVGFGSRYEQHELPFETPAVMHEATPGPGSYDPMMTNEGGSYDPGSSSLYPKGAQLVGHTSRFKPTHIPDALTGHFAPGIAQDLTRDPTQYDPARGREIKDTASATFNEKGQHGKGGFNASEEGRVLKLSNDPLHAPKLPDGTYNKEYVLASGNHYVTPGPAAYKPQVTETGREQDMTTLNGCEAMKSAAFASKVARVPAPHNEKVPGPGQYDPNFESIEPSAHNAMSHVGRDSTVPSQWTSGLLSSRRFASTGPGVGPGTYDPITTNNGDLDTIQGRSERKADFGAFGWNASFISDSLRTFFSGLFPDKPSTSTAVSV